MPPVLTNPFALFFVTWKSFVWLLFWAPLWALGAWFFLERRNRK